MCWGGCVRGSRRSISDTDPPARRVDVATRNPLSRSPSPERAPKRRMFWPRQKRKSAFSVLPVEIRRMIWEYVLGGRGFHMEMQGPMRLWSFYCLSEDPTVYKQKHEECWAAVFAAWRAKSKPKSPYQISLLRTCRQIYIEAIPFLYSSNHFIIHQHTILEYLPLILLPQRITSIRSIHFPYLISIGGPHFRANDPEQALRRRQASWDAVWRHLASMTTLQRLHVELSISHGRSPAEYWEHYDRESAAKMVEPIKDLDRLGSGFVLVLPFPRMGSGDRYAEGGRNWAGDERWEGEDPWEELGGEILRVRQRR